MFQCFGSQCTMFLQSIYDYIEHKLKLIPMAISGIGVDSRHFYGRRYHILELTT